MAYFEYLRTRRSFLIFAAFLLALTAAILVIVSFHSRDIQIGIGHHHTAVSVIFFTSLAAWGTAILASINCASLNRQREHLPYTWTRPQSREQMALELIAVDLAIMIAAFVLVVGLEMLVFAILTEGRIPLLWRGTGAAFLRGFGFALMWYSMVQAATAWASFRGSVVAGISWPIFIIVAGLEAARFPAPWSEILTFVNIFNPMAYLSGTEVSRSGEVVLHSVIPFADSVRLALMYGLSLLALVVAVFSWKRMEA
ncbi:MAG: hypothetical protein JO101_00165 [Candidatus Eremiobacteraeota bacterium]|nr:hypothetical protein [Candidatus Eremiobacteraeota bacterium]MBV8353706.1 hypothetical protein [Candidatus Eremiobacteraeota bacterium]